MKYLNRYIHTVSATARVAALLLLAFVFVFSQKPMTAIADPPTNDQLQAITQWPNWVASVCGSSTTTIDTSPGTGAPGGLSYPNLDASAMADAINAFIQQENPSSRMKGLGATLVASAKNANVSPFLVVAIAYKESALSDPGDYNVSHGSNSFGREATASQPHFSGAHLWYKWSSVKASVDYTAPENRGVSGGGDFPSYLRAQYGGIIDSNNFDQFFAPYAPPSENNTAKYIQDVKGWLSDMATSAGNTPADGSAPLDATQTTSTCANACSSGASDTTTLSGSDNQEKIFNYFVDKGLTPVQAASIDGNFGQESGWNPGAIQPGGPGRGIAQWSVGDRWDTNPNGNVASFAQKNGGSPTSLSVQLDFVWYELNHSFSSVLTELKTANDIATATALISSKYEVAGTPNLSNRISYANSALHKYGGGAADGSSPTPGCSAAVQCDNSQPAAPGLSQTRQNIVCIAQQELTAWTSGAMKLGYRANSADSYSKYSQNNEEEWCADFVSWVYNQINYPIGSGSNWRVPAVATIQSIGQQNANFHWHPAAGYTPKPGDLAIHGSSHINIVTAVSGSAVTVIGGDQAANAQGAPDGTRVSKYQLSDFTGDGTTGYVSPD